MIKELAGVPGHRPLPENEPEPVGSLQDPPEHLTAEEKETWVFAIEHSPPGLLRLLDSHLFLSWVRAATELELAEQKIAELGRVVKQGGAVRTTTTPEGKVTKTVRSDMEVESTWVGIRDKAFVRMVRATSELGFSPTSRSRISLAGGGKKDANRFAKHATPAARRA